MEEGEKPAGTLQRTAEREAPGPEGEKPSSHLCFRATSSRETPVLMARCER